MRGSALWQTVAAVCIVAATAVILVGPVTGAVRASSNQICQDNLRAIWKALSAYQSDYAGAVPRIDNGAIPLHSWVDDIRPYGVSIDRLKCPSQSIEKERLWRSIWSWKESPYTYGYAINANCCLDNPWQGLKRGLPFNYDRVLLVSDGYWSWFTYDDSWDPKGTDPGRPNWWSNKVAWRHPGPPDPASTKAATNFITISGQVVNLKRPVSQNRYVIDIGARGTGVPPSAATAAADGGLVE